MGGKSTPPGSGRLDSSRMWEMKFPHSWGIYDWPPNVYPHTVSRARYLVRAQRDALIRAGALTRIGRDLVIIGARYTRFLEKGCSKVADFECPANRELSESRGRK